MPDPPVVNTGGAVNPIESGSARLQEPRTVTADRGAAWIGEAFELFKKDPGTWIGIFVLWIVAAVVIGQIPFLGSLATSLVTPVLMGGLMLGCKAQSEGQPLRVEHLWSGFNHPQFSQLLLIGVAYLVFGLVVAVIGGGVFVALIGGEILGRTADASAAGIGIGALVGVLVVVALAFLVAMATWLAPQLVVLGGRSAIDAIKLSFAASLKNIPALLIYGVLALLMIIVASIPFGLGLLVAGPVLIIASFVTWRDLYG